MEGPPGEAISLAERRLLTEVNHLLAGRNADGNYDPGVLIGVRENLRTKVQEDAMSGAVTNSFQPKAEIANDSGELRWTYIWKGLGRTAVDVAESGYEYHFSDAAFQRVGVEVQEAERSSELKPGITQSFISPRMSPKDAPRYLAESEHLANEDAIRTSRAVVDENGEIVGRQMQSLLVRDMPLSAWVAMLKNPQNIFGKAFEISDEASALGVMKLFDQLDLPDELLPEGPVSIVAEAANYITDPKARSSVDRQIECFRGDQQRLNEVAEATSDQWLEFEIEMAESLSTKRMQPKVKAFVIQLQSEWPDDVLKLLKMHESGSEYEMSEVLAAKLEQAWQKIHVGEAAIIVDDERALKDMDKAEIRRLQNNIQYINILEANGAPPTEIARLRTQNYREIAVSNVKPGGGCSPVNGFTFDSGSPDGLLQDGISREQTAGIGESSDKIGKTKMGVCRIERCPTRPGKTLVGGCDVCLASCQKLFDANKDPAEVYGKEPRRIEKQEVQEIKPAEPKLKETPSRQRLQENHRDDETEMDVANMSGKLALMN